MSKTESGWKKGGAYALIVLGMLLMLFMIIYEDEPGGIPLIMILLGSAYLIWRRFQHDEAN